MNKGAFRINASAATKPPRAKDPVSPINTLAGYVLKIKKPSRVPTIIIAVRYTGDSIFNESTTKNIAITTVTEVASPSSPSVKLAPFTVPSTATNTKGTNSTPRFQATCPPVKGIIICVSSG